MARRRNAWLTPDDDDESLVAGCLSIPRPLVPAVVGALSPLTEIWNWEQFGTMTADKASFLATRMLLDFELSGCNGEMACIDVLECLLDAGYTPALRRRVVDGIAQYSLDDGATWHDVPTTNGNAITFPELTETEGSTAQERICLAATRAANTLSEFHSQTWGMLQAGLGQFASAWIQNTITFIEIAINGNVGQPIGTIAGEALRQLAIDPNSFVTNGLPPEQLCQLIQLLEQHGSDNAGIVTFDYEAVTDNLPTTVTAGYGADVWALLQFIGEDGLNAAGQVNNTSVGNCDCDEQDCGDVRTGGAWWLSYYAAVTWSGNWQWFGNNERYISPDDASAYFEVDLGETRCIQAVAIRPYSNLGGPANSASQWQSASVIIDGVTVDTIPIEHNLGQGYHDYYNAKNDNSIDNNLSVQGRYIRIQRASGGSTVSLDDLLLWVEFGD